MTLPPYAAVLGITVEDCAAGDGAHPPVLVMPFADDVLGRPGFVHGGAIAGLLELAALATLDRALAAEGGGVVVPVTATVDFMRGGRARATRATARVIRIGTRIATVEGTAWQDDAARPIASARTTYRITR